MIPIELHYHPKETCFLNIQKSCYSISEYIYNNKNYDSINYKLYYDFNPAIGFGFWWFPESKRLGYHPVDVERVKILVDKNTQNPEYVYFSAHSNEGKWVPWKDCEKTDDNHLIIYIARGSHANYPRSGIWVRILGFANDLCSKKGKKFIPILRQNQEYKHENPNVIHRGFFKRFFFCYP